MRWKAAVLASLALTSAFALDARKAPEEYPEQSASSDFRAGVEYMVRTFVADGASFLVDDYLIVEIGVFPRPIAHLDIQRFKLRINGKTLLLTQTPGIVAASLKYSDWTQRPTVQANVGMGDRDILIGRPPRTQRFPGDPTVRQPPPQVDNRIEGRPEQAPIDYTDLVQRAALPEGDFNKPIAGLLFFPYDGKLKKIKSVELLIDDTVLKLR